MKATDSHGGRFVGGRDRLGQSALRLKKAWLLAAILAGGRLAKREAVIPNYETWTRKDLRRHVADLETDLQEVLGVILVRKPRRVNASAVNWLAEKFDEWAAAGYGLFVVSTTRDFEANVERLRGRDALDVPPYAQVLLQPGTAVAFRHPEYMLARDLELLYGLFRDAEELLAKLDWSEPPDWAAAASENALALGRATIQCCFNLLEAFTAGLAKARLMSANNLDETTSNQLRDSRSSLRKRIIRVAGQLRPDKPALDSSQPPFSILFDEVKVRRDSMVHCEPGPEESERGYVKEELFHDAFAPQVEKAVNATCDAICVTWKHVHDAPRPRWLHARGQDGRFARRNLRLCPQGAS
jgi:hypothetical protein